MNKAKYICMMFLAAVFTVSSVFISNEVFGYAGGTNQPNKPNNGCDPKKQLFNTCYGIGWELYDANENPSGTTRDSNGDLFIEKVGQAGGGTTIKTKTKCKDGKYWRLAFYALKSGSASTGTYYKKDEQVGMLSLQDIATTFPSAKGKIYNEAQAKAAWDDLPDSQQSDGTTIYEWNDSSDLAWFCAEPATVELNAKAAISGTYNSATNTRTELKGGKVVATSGAVSIGEKASVTAPPTIAENGKTYTFFEWGGGCANKGGTANNINRTCTINKLNKGASVWAYYKPKYTLTMVGRIAGDTSNANIWTDNMPKVTNWEGSTVTIEAPQTLTYNGRTYMFSHWGTSCQPTTDHPNRQNNDDYNVRTCTVTNLAKDLKVAARYKLPPPLPCSDNNGYCGIQFETRQNKTNDTTNYNNWTTGDLYMKPGDNVYVKGRFNPLYQNYMGLTPYGIRLYSHPRDDNGNPKYWYLPYVYSDIDVVTLAEYLDYAGGWKKNFGIAEVNLDGSAVISCPQKVSGQGFGPNYYGSYTYTAQLGTSKTMQSRISEAKCGLPPLTPDGIAFGYDGNYNLMAEIHDNLAATNTVTTYTPYNFKTSTTINNNENEVVYAGEKVTIKYNINVNKKKNFAVGGDEYYTKVPNSKRRLRISYSDDTSYNTNLIIQDLWGNEGEQSLTLNVKDLPAGSKMCVTSALYPQSSGDDTNWQDQEGNHAWTYSDEKCFTIAKRPSFQVWGSGIFTNGKISLNPAIKNNLDDDIVEHPYNITGDNPITFSSWAELGIVANGPVRGLASGAGTGYGNTEDARKIVRAKTTESNYSNISAGINSQRQDSRGGKSGNNFCFISTLSIPNTNCKNGTVGVGNNNNSIQSNSSSDKSNLIARFKEGDNDAAYTLETVTDNTTIEGMTIGQYATKVIKAENKDITINGNINYEDTTYTTLASIPKLIIYANNIKINCNVTRIDAVLIAEQDINTCVDNEGNDPPLNDGARSTQLIINGATISDTLTLNRTYGAATGKNSIIPAEIINYDSSLLLWSNKQSKTTTTGRITESLRRELAPRY